eukprot:GDKI01014849.1.p1 GENE.GDKI01014849.1~~GDKI01014849.1.p1  ORF type:complete len:176 (-),score=54.46 GDKI01014849.1:29-556(-)
MAEKFELLPLFPGRQVSLQVFKNVSNPEEVLAEAMKESTDVCVFMNAALVTSPFQVLCAVNKALHNQATGKMRTKTLATEILYSMSPSTNITESLKFFGLNPKVTAVLAIALDASEEKQTHIQSVVKGEVCGLGELESLLDRETIMKHAKCGEEEASLPGGLEAALVARGAVKAL